MTLLTEFSISPLGASSSVGQYVAQCIELVEKSGLPFRLNPMGTVVEGDYAEVTKLMGQCLERLQEAADRVSLSIKMDWRRGTESRLKQKTKSVEDILGRKIPQ